MSVDAAKFLNMKNDADLMDIFGPALASRLKSDFVLFNRWYQKDNKRYRIYITNELKQMVFSEEFKSFVGGYMAGRDFNFG